MNYLILYVFLCGISTLLGLAAVGPAAIIENNDRPGMVVTLFLMSPLILIFAVVLGTVEWVFQRRGR